MSASLDLYRSLVPAHARVPDDTVETWLTVAARRHTATAWGGVYTEAMVYWAAAQIEPQVRAGILGGTETCADPAAPAVDLVDPRSTPYWTQYIDARDSRAASAPTRVSAGDS